jgi:hypothetical protein
MRLSQRTTSILLLAICHACILSANAHASGGLALDEARSLAYAGTSGTVVTLDITDPINPQALPGSIAAGGVIQALAVDPTTQRLYIAADDGGLEIWDVGGATPQLLSTFEVVYFGAVAPVRDVVVSGSYAYVAAYFGGVNSIDVSDPSQPVHVGFSLVGGPTHGVTIDGDELYAAGDRLTRFALRADGLLTTSGQSYAASSNLVFAHGTEAYIDTRVNPRSFSVIDTTVSNLPFIGDATYEHSNVRDIFADGDYVYIADPFEGVLIYDVSDPTDPVQIGVEPDASASDVIVSDGYAYARAGNTFRIVDVSSPSNPSVLSVKELPEPGVLISLGSGWLLLAWLDRRRWR